MKPKSNAFAGTLLLFAFAVTLLIFFTNVNRLRPDSVMQWEFYLHWTSQCAGVFITTISGFALLLRGLSGHSIESLSPLILPLIAGLALLTSHWVAVLSLGLVALTIAIIPIVSLFRSSRSVPKVED